MDADASGDDQIVARYVAGAVGCEEGDSFGNVGRGSEYLFKTASAKLDPHQRGWTLHQLRHSALQHLAQAGRSAPELQAKSRHQHLASLGHYVRLGEETSARISAEADPAQRRRPR